MLLSDIRMLSQGATFYIVRSGTHRYPDHHRRDIIKMTIFYEKLSGYSSMGCETIAFARRNLHVARSGIRVFSDHYRKGMSNVSVTCEKHSGCSSVWCHEYFRWRKPIYR